MISEKDIRDIAKLAHLEIKDEEIEKLRNDFSSILDYVNKLKEIDTAEITETANLSQVSNIERADDAHRFDKDLLVQAMPKNRNDYLEVKKVLYND